MPPDWDDTCKACAGQCCSFVQTNISFTEVPKGRRYDYWLRKDMNKGQLIRPSGKVPEMQWVITRDGDRRNIRFDCAHRTEEGRCGIYEDRPGMCREFTCTALRGEEALGEMLSHTHARESYNVERVVAEDVMVALEEVA